ncbi:hypothetical protein MJD09_25905 [bacterium]|nr:hypothetical protein [bacterium]
MNASNAGQNQSTTREITDFHAHFRPYVNRIYRGSLILTSSPDAAQKLQTEIYLKAFLEYVHVGRVSQFNEWLLDIVADCFSEQGITGKQPANQKIDGLRQKAIQAIVNN